MLISHSTYQMVQDKVAVRFVDRVRVVGRTKPVDVYVPLGEHGNVDKETLIFATAYKKAWEAMNRRDFAVALKMLDALCADHPDDGPCEILRSRVLAFMQTSPSPEWDGVHTLKTKK